MRYTGYMSGVSLTQPLLFDQLDTATGTVELFPAVWRAAEELSSPDAATRHDALDRLVELDAPRLSPLVAYVLVTRIIDPDIELRLRVVSILGKILSLKGEGKDTPESVRQHLKGYLSLMSHRGLLPVLEVAEKYPSSESDVAALLNACSHAGTLLADMVVDRRAPMGMRRQAVNFIGQVGFLNAIPALERLAERLETRMSGQKSMPFAPPSRSEEMTLLPAVQAALTFLRQP